MVSEIDMSKSSSKRRTKKDLAGNTAGVQNEAQDLNNAGDDVTNGMDEAYESAYIKEVQKNIRNIAKKLSTMSKVDAIIAENPNVSLDDLVTSRKINNDQKAQALKKPSLQSALTQLEDQVNQYKKIDEDFQRRLASEKERLHAAHRKELEDSQGTTKAQAGAEAKKELRQQLLVLSRFLRAAAARRQMDDDSSDESKAFEGLLLLLYGGDTTAVDAAEKLIGGASDDIPSTDGTTVPVTYDRIKQISLEYAPFAAEEAWANDVAQADHPDHSIVSPDMTRAIDPTIANAGLNELDAQPGELNHQMVQNSMDGPEQAGIDEGAANNTATQQWDSQVAGSADQMGESWISVPRDPLETETPSTAAANNVTHNWATEAPTMAPTINATPSWADEVPSTAKTWADEISAEVTAANGSVDLMAKPSNDGYLEVHHTRGGRGRGGNSGEQRGGNRGRGSFRGGEQGGYRGRGSYRGERGGEGQRGRGRGRGSRGGRGREES